MTCCSSCRRIAICLRLRTAIAYFPFSSLNAPPCTPRFRKWRIRSDVVLRRCVKEASVCAYDSQMVSHRSERSGNAEKQQSVSTRSQTRSCSSIENDRKDDSCLGMYLYRRSAREMRHRLLDVSGALYADTERVLICMIACVHMPRVFFYNISGTAFGRTRPEAWCGRGSACVFFSVRGWVPLTARARAHDRTATPPPPLRR